MYNISIYNQGWKRAVLHRKNIIIKNMFRESAKMVNAPKCINVVNLCVRLSDNTTLRFSLRKGSSLTRIEIIHQQVLSVLQMVFSLKLNLS